MHARLRPAGEHGVGIAALDQLRGLADRMRAGRAGRDDRVVRASDPERDRELPAGGVDEDVRQEVRRDAVRPALAQDLVLLEDPADTADGRAEDDADAHRIEAVQARVPDRLAARRRATSRTLRSSLRTSFGDATRLGSKSFTSAAIRTGRPVASKARIQSIPLSPAERRVARWTARRSRAG